MGSPGFSPNGPTVTTAPVDSRMTTSPIAGMPACRGLTVPRRLGGAGAGLGQAAMVIGTLARGEPSTALVLTMHFLQHGLIHARAASPEESWPQAIADGLGRAAVEDGALINALRVEPELGTPSMGRHAGDAGSGDLHRMADQRPEDLFHRQPGPHPWPRLRPHR